MHHGAPINVLSQLLETYTAAASVKNRYSETPLHIFCQHSKLIASTFDFIKLLMEKNYNAVIGRDSAGRTPSGRLSMRLNLGLPKDPEKRMIYEKAQRTIGLVSTLLQNKDDDAIVESTLEEFTKTKWPGGIGIALSIRPDLIPLLENQDAVMPSLLFFLGKCKITALWKCIRDRQDLLENI
mmetsp:Transcript_20374/g.26851  ORF Transcript_20374/g.26851 Transcript_20374/m.26851 type:complete len:182 (-) Transcript_20374:194-739(-)